MGGTDGDKIKFLLNVNGIIRLIRNTGRAAVKSSFLIIFNLSQLLDLVDDKMNQRNLIKFEMDLGIFQNELSQ